MILWGPVEIAWPTSGPRCEAQRCATPKPATGLRVCRHLDPERAQRVAVFRGVGRRPGFEPQIFSGSGYSS